MKTPTRAWLALAFLLLLHSRAWAFLGDDLPTIEAHYGAALNRFQLAPGLEASVHETTGYRVLVLYRDGHSNRETFSKLAAPFEFTAPETDTFLWAHGAGLPWDALGSHHGASLWSRPYALATYLADDEKTTLTFEAIGNDPTTDAATPTAAALSAALASTKDPPASVNSLTLGTLDLGQLQIGALSLGQLQTGKLQTGKLQIGTLQTGKLQIGSLNEPARPAHAP